MKTLSALGKVQFLCGRLRALVPTLRLCVAKSPVYIWQARVTLDWAVRVALKHNLAHVAASLVECFDEVEWQRRALLHIAEARVTAYAAAVRTHASDAQDELREALALLQRALDLPASPVRSPLRSFSQHPHPRLRPNLTSS